MFSTNGKHSFDVKDFLIKSKAKQEAIKLIPEFYKKQLNELEQVAIAGDDQLVESYNFLSKVGLRKIIAFFKSINEACSLATILVKTTRKPRKTKERPASVQVAKLKYLKEDIELRLKSTTPDKIIGADEIWLFNSQHRKLFKYVAQEGMKLAVKGTSLQNFDPEKSSSKKIRKPEEFFKDLMTQTKRAWNKAFTEIRGATGIAVGRFNDQTLILKSF
jgi:hypothetical protein